MNNRITFSDEIILQIEFLHPQDFFSLSLMGINYEIIAKDDVGNSIGIAPDQQVFYLESAFETLPDSIRYISNNVESFVQELKLYKKYSENYVLEDNPSDEELETYANGFRKLITALDANACDREDSFWSVIAEQMETEQL